MNTLNLMQKMSRDVGFSPGGRISKSDHEKAGIGIPTSRLTPPSGGLPAAGRVEGQIIQKLQIPCDRST